MAKKRLTALQILKDSRADITPKTWVCGDLDICNLTGEEVTHQACAIGLVSLNSDNVFHVELEFHNDEIGMSIFKKMVRASYPAGGVEGESMPWNKAGIAALRYLVRAMDPDAIPDDFEYRGTFDTVSKASPERLSNIVVWYNDSVVGLTSNPVKAAQKWFDAAIKLAEKKSKKS